MNPLVDFDVRAEAGAPTIHYALSAIKGVGEAQAEALVDARGARAFASLGDMAARLDPRAVNKKALESLAAAGAFDGLEPNRAAAFAAIEPMLAIANREVMQKAAGQNALFGEAEARAAQGARRAVARIGAAAGASSTPSASSSPAIRSKSMTRRSSA